MEKKLIFEARCLRCQSLNEIDFNERFGESTTEIANRWIWDLHEGFLNKCPKCERNTIHCPVDLINE